ncbi:MAG: hypothetical protein DRJ05_04510 [Bacteroidetes bacterium]|nr:MAG: hypothetical protein DRJ05_04510 [Bacteroidota bacterium]
MRDKSIYIYFRFLLYILIIHVISSCSTTKHLEKNESLLIHNKIEITNPVKGVSAEDLFSLIQQKSNTRMLNVVPFKLWLHSFNKKWGEPPVIFDEGLVAEGKDQMLKYLENIGYFDSKISFNQEIKKTNEKKLKAKYRITLSQPYTLRNIDYQISDDSIKSLFLNDTINSVLKTNQIYNAFLFDKERERVEGLLKDNGYFGFDKNYIVYSVDSALDLRQMDVSLRINNRLLSTSVPGEIPKEINHKVYYINDIYVYPDYKALISDTASNDTLLVIPNVQKKSNPYTFYFSPPLKIKPKVISRSTFFESGKKYNATDARQTFEKINNLRIYKYITFDYDEVKANNRDDSLKNYLDCTMKLSRNPVHSYSAEAQGTNSGGDLGLGGYLTYQNRNIFRGAEILDVRLKLAVEAQNRGLTSSENETTYFYLFNTLEYGVDAKLEIPKFLAPIRQGRFSRYFRPVTTISAGYNFQDRREYLRVITNLAFGYEWSVSKFKRHLLTPIDINFIKVNTTAGFDSILQYESQRFRDQYTDKVIFASRYTYIYNNQQINKNRNFTFFRWDLESSGFLLNGLIKGTGQPVNEEGYRTVFGIRYSQYVKTNFDFRYYVPIKNEHSLAFRTFFGIAAPYGNSIDVPFEKGFYGGGANGLRAWQLRYLGPGAYPNTNPNIERVGDFQLEGNFEYRFPVYKFFQGALFYDVGNIWLFKSTETYPGGKFEFNSFLGELAMDVGFGFRFNFSYFIFRIDMAQRITDPALPAYERWVPGSYKKWFDPIFNLGIGYPF